MVFRQTYIYWQSVTLLSENLITNVTLVLPSESIVLLLSQIYFLLAVALKLLSLLFCLFL